MPYFIIKGHSHLLTLLCTLILAFNHSYQEYLHAGIRDRPEPTNTPSNSTQLYSYVLLNFLPITAMRLLSFQGRTLN